MSPPWLREQILANARQIFYMQKPASLDIITGRYAVACVPASQSGTPGRPEYTSVQYMHYAHVHSRVTTNNGDALGIVLVHGPPVTGTVEDAMVELSKAVEVTKHTIRRAMTMQALTNGVLKDLVYKNVAAKNYEKELSSGKNLL